MFKSISNRLKGSVNKFEENKDLCVMKWRNSYVQGVQIVVGNVEKAGHKRSESRVAGRIGRAGYGRHRPAPEIAFHENNLRLVVGDLLVRVAPFASQFARRFTSFHS